MALAASLALGACGGDDGGPDDGPPRDDAPRTDAATDGAVIDGPTDARGIDAMADAPAGPTFNGCTQATALDRTEIADQREVVIAGLAYNPPCIEIRRGQGVIWSGDLAAHPLRPGVIVDGAPLAQAGNPIPPTSSGGAAVATFPTAGTYGYYCDLHWSAGMKGAIYVLP